MSETDLCRELLAPFAVGLGFDMGFGGSSLHPGALNFDMPNPYTSVGQDQQHFQGDARVLPFVCDGALDYIYSSHLLEDFTYPALHNVLKEWRRCIKHGGLLITNCPDQQRFLAHCAATGQGINLAHAEPDFSLDNFRRVLNEVGEWEEVFVEPVFGNYSWLLVARKV